jgi:tRNA(Met) C34 N-acetyltransferase TmcA
MPANALKCCIDELLEVLQIIRQRRIVVLRGAREDCDEALDLLLESRSSAVLISDRHGAPRAIPCAQAEACLGGETTLLALDLFDGFNPDVVCIAAGLVRAGGILLLLAPTAGEWDPATDNYARWQDGQRSLRPCFVEYFFSALADEPGVGQFLSPEDSQNPFRHCHNYSKRR